MLLQTITKPPFTPTGVGKATEEQLKGIKNSKTKIIANITIFLQSSSRICLSFIYSQEISFQSPRLLSLPYHL